MATLRVRLQKIYYVVYTYKHDSTDPIGFFFSTINKRSAYLHLSVYFHILNSKPVSKYDQNNYIWNKSRITPELAVAKYSSRIKSLIFGIRWSQHRRWMSSRNLRCLPGREREKKREHWEHCCLLHDLSLNIGVYAGYNNYPKYLDIFTLYFILYMYYTL